MMSTEQFHWTTPNGETITLPHMGKIKAGVLRKIRNAEPVDAMFTLLESVADDATLAKVDDLDSADLNALFEAWQEATASTGESGGSSS